MDIPSRRDFLILAGTAIAAGLVGSKVGNWVGNKFVEDYNSLDAQLDKLNLSKEAREKISEIKKFRESLGLDDYPPEMIWTLREDNKWEGEVLPFENKLPNKNLSYGMYTERVLKNTFGDNAFRLVRGAMYDPTLPGAMAFNNESRFCIFPETVHDNPINEYINFILHEGVGHGSDPSFTRYPNETFVQVEHGKWMALTQMFNIPGEFLNNPGDLMYPILKKELGRVTGFTLLKNGNLLEILDGSGQDLVWRELKMIAKEQGKDVKDIKFNKGVSKRLGGLIVPAVLNRQISILGDLRNIYHSTFEWVGAEIYAEMVRYSILYPEKINSEIIQKGIASVIAAINGKGVNLQELKMAIAKPDQEIVNRNLAEQNAIQGINIQTDEAPQPVENEVPISTITPQEGEVIAVQEAEIKAQLSTFDNFIYSGNLPETLVVPANMKVGVTNFAKLYSDFNVRHPGMIYIDMNYDDSFDPPTMHIWEITELGYALDPAFVRGIINSQNLSEETYDEILRKSRIIEYFTNIDI